MKNIGNICSRFHAEISIVWVYRCRWSSFLCVFLHPQTYTSRLESCPRWAAAVCSNRQCTAAAPAEAAARMSCSSQIPRSRDYTPSVMHTHTPIHTHKQIWIYTHTHKTICTCTRTRTHTSKHRWTRQKLSIHILYSYIILYLYVHSGFVSVLFLQVTTSSCSSILTTVTWWRSSLEWKDPQTVARHWSTTKGQRPSNIYAHWKNCISHSRMKRWNGLTWPFVILLQRSLQSLGQCCHIGVCPRHLQGPHHPGGRSVHPLFLIRGTVHCYNIHTLGSGLFIIHMNGGGVATLHMVRCDIWVSVCYMFFRCFINFYFVKVWELAAGICVQFPGLILCCFWPRVFWRERNICFYSRWSMLYESCLFVPFGISAWCKYYLEQESVSVVIFHAVLPVMRVFCFLVMSEQERLSRRLVQWGMSGDEFWLWYYFLFM